MSSPFDARVRPAPPEQAEAYFRRVRAAFSTHSPIHDGAITDALALRGHTDLVRALAITPDGKTLISGSADHTIRRWDLTSGTAIGEPLEGHTNMVFALAITPDGTRLVTPCAPSEATGLVVPLRTTGPVNTSLAYTPTVYTFGHQPDR